MTRTPCIFSSLSNNILTDQTIYFLFSLHTKNTYNCKNAHEMFSVKQRKNTIRLANILNLIEVMKFGILIAFTALKFEYSHVRHCARNIFGLEWVPTN